MLYFYIGKISFFETLTAIFSKRLFLTRRLKYLRN